MFKPPTALRSRDNIPVLVAGAVALAAVAVRLAPAEATLGQSVRFVYAHAALMWVGFGLLTLGGLAGWAFLIRRSPRLLEWSIGCLVVGLVIIASTGLLGMWTAKLTWGGIFWAEPRMAMLLKILAAGSGAIVAGKLSGSPVVAGAANGLAATAAWIWLLQTRLVIHPANPIFTSESAAIKLFPLAIGLLLGFAALQIVRYWTTDH
jgi:hypothetical protein